MEELMTRWWRIRRDFVDNHKIGKMRRLRRLDVGARNRKWRGGSREGNDDDRLKAEAGPRELPD